MFVDNYVGGLGGYTGGAVESLQRIHFEPGLARPYIAEKGKYQGKPVVCINTHKQKKNHDTNKYHDVYMVVPVEEMRRRGFDVPTCNASSLRREQWLKLDEAVVMATRQRLSAWDTVAAANTYDGFDGMATLTLEYDAMSDPGEAIVDMELMAEGRTDSPLFKTRSLPLPVTHSDFVFGQRRLAVSGNGGRRLDMTMAEAAGRRIGESVERVTIGTETGMTFGTQTVGYGTHDGTSTVYGMTNYPNRIIYNALTTPTGSNPEATIANVIAMREAAYARGFFGPFVLFTSTGWDAFLDNDYFRTGGTSVTRTLRERIESIQGIQRVQRLDFLTSGYQLILVQMTSDVIRAVVGMRLTTVQWETRGGAQQHFRVMCIYVPQIRSDYSGNCGIVHGTVP